MSLSLKLEIFHQVRTEVWKMRNALDPGPLLRAICEGLGRLGLRFDFFGINLIDVQASPPSGTAHFRTPAGEWRQQSYPQLEGSPLLAIWEKQKLMYRDDLEVADPYGERPTVGGRGIRCLVDIPFSHGTLALSSKEPQAFSVGDLELLEEMAALCSEGFRRLDDLQALEQRAQEAEALSAAIAVVAGARGLEEVFETVVQEAARLTRAERATLFLYDEGEKALVPRAQLGHNWAVYRQLRLQPGEDRSGQVFVSGEATLYNYSLSMVDQTLRPENRTLLVAAVEGTAATEVVVPLKLGGRVMGTLSVRSQQYCCTQRDLVLLERLATQAALAIERAQAAQALKENAQRLELLEGLSRSIAVTLDLDSLLQQTLAQLSGIFSNLDLAILYLWDPQEKALVPRAWLGVNGEAIAQLRLESGESISGKVFQTGRAVFTRTQEEAAALRGELRPGHARLFARAIGEVPLQSNLCAPLRMASGEILGTFTISSARMVFSQTDLALLEGVAGQLAQAIDNAQLYAQAQGFSRRLVQAQEKERRRVARELHDGLGQTLAAIRFQVQKAARQFAHGEAAADLREISLHLQDAIQETRALSHDLRPSVLDDLGLLAALRALCRGFGERTGLPVELEADEEMERLPAEVETALYRIAQEGLRNIERHARARRVQLRLRRQEREGILEIRDEGQGMDEGQVSAGMGLTNMRERAALIGGQLEVESAPGRGVLLRVRTPLPPATPDPERQEERDAP